MVKEAKAFEACIAGRLYRAGLRRCLWLRARENDNLFELSGHKGVFLPIVEAETDGVWLAMRAIVPGVLEFGELLLPQGPADLALQSGERMVRVRYRLERNMTVVSPSCFRVCVREWEMLSLIPGARITLRWGSRVEGLSELPHRYCGSLPGPDRALSGGEQR